MQFLRTAFQSLSAGNVLGKCSNPFGAIYSANLSSLVPRNPSSRGDFLEAPSLLTNSVRTIIRNHFPKPGEAKRIRVHGLKKRLSAPGGRLIIVKRIVRRKHVLAHGW